VCLEVDSAVWSSPDPKVFLGGANWQLICNKCVCNVIHTCSVSTFLIFSMIFYLFSRVAINLLVGRMLPRAARLRCQGPQIARGRGWPRERFHPSSGAWECFRNGTEVQLEGSHTDYSTAKSRQWDFENCTCLYLKPSTRITHKGPKGSPATSLHSGRQDLTLDLKRNTARESLLPLLWHQASLASVNILRKIWGWVKTLVPSEPQNSW
jgi:hypothetical protein